MNLGKERDAIQKGNYSLQNNFFIQIIRFPLFRINQNRKNHLISHKIILWENLRIETIYIISRSGWKVINYIGLLSGWHGIRNREANKKIEEHKMNENEIFRLKNFK